MFAWLKKQTAKTAQAQRDVAVEAAEDRQKFMLQVTAALGSTPPEMIDDPFIVGAIVAHTGIICKVISNGQSPMSMIESGATLAVQLTFAGSGVSREKAIQTLFHFKNHPEYSKAAQIVTLILAARFDRRDLANDPLISEAKLRVNQMPKQFRAVFGDTLEEQVAHELTQQLFIGPLKTRYGTQWQRR